MRRGEVADQVNGTGEGSDLGWARHTRSRRELVELIRTLPGQFTSADLVERARKRRISRATVFRLLDQLVQMNVLSRLHGPDGCSTYTLCETPQHHHHLVCRSCGSVTPIETAAIESQIRSLARGSGFQVDAHHLEVFGRCGACSS